MATKLLALLFLAVGLAACAAPQPTMPRPQIPDLPGAEATYFAAVQVATATADAATAVANSQASAATATADYVRFEQATTMEAQAAQTQATADYLAMQATEIAQAMLIDQATAVARPTMTAESQAALVAQRLIDDETRRLENQRQAEMVAIQRAAMWNATWPWLVALAAVLLLAVAAVLARAVWLRAQPVVINYPQAAPQTLVYSDGGWRVVAPSRQLPASDRLLPPPAPLERPQPIMLPPLVQGHTLIVGITGDGKSMALREIVDQRRNVTVLDPHNTPGAWGTARVIGGGSDYESIVDFMRHLHQELMTRTRARAQGRLQFDEMTVATEEMPAIIDRAGREVGPIWRAIMREGRKFGLYMVVVTQSTRVKTLGVEGEGDLLENFRHVVLLGKAAVERCPDIVSGMRRPAALLSGHAEPQPIIIPYDPCKDPGSPQFQPSLSDSFYLADDAPTTNHAEPGMATEGGFVSRVEMDRILALHDAGHSRRSISTEMYGTVGGAGFLRVKGVLDTLVGAITG